LKDKHYFRLEITPSVQATHNIGPQKMDLDIKTKEETTLFVEAQITYTLRV